MTRRFAATGPHGTVTIEPAGDYWQAHCTTCQWWSGPANLPGATGHALRHAHTHEDHHG